MNVQFSFSSSGTYSPLNNASTSPQPNVVPATANVSEMKQMEKEGVVLPVGQEELMRRLDYAFKALSGPETTLQVSMHKETNSIMVKVLDKETGKVIREVPPEKTLDLVANMMHIAGILVDKRT
ncbi:flagellar protein FlaG [Paenibacillus kyungheensis]